MASIEEQAKSLDIKSVIVSLIISAFGFVAALFWRDAIKALIEEVVPQGQGITAQFTAAIIVTIIAVVAIYIVSKYLTRISIRETVKKATEIKKK